MFYSDTLIFPTGGRSNYRIPSIVVTKKGTVLAFCNDRKDTNADHADECDLVVCRKEKDGKWSEVTCLAGISKWSHMIGAAVYDEITDTVFCSFTRKAVRLNEFGDYSDEQRRQMEEEEKKLAQKAGLGIGHYLLESTDDGLTWVERAMEIQPTVMADAKGVVRSFEGFTHGSAAGIQLKYGKYAGRLACPARFMTDHYTTFEELQIYAFNNVLYSDDHGKTWISGDPVQPGTGEGTLIERGDGTILYNSRAYYFDQKRYLAVSEDGGATFSAFSTDDFLIEEKRMGCNASFLRVERSALPVEQAKLLPEGAEAITLFANPRAADRRNMTVCVSFDDGDTWVHTKTVRKEPSGYSSLTYSAADGHFYLLYEAGVKEYLDLGLTVGEFDLEWLLQ